MAGLGSQIFYIYFLNGTFNLSFFCTFHCTLCLILSVVVYFQLYCKCYSEKTQKIYPSCTPLKVLCTIFYTFFFYSLLYCTHVWHPSILPLSRDEKDCQYTSLALVGVFSPDRNFYHFYHWLIIVEEYHSTSRHTKNFAFTVSIPYILILICQYVTDMSLLVL